MGYASLTPRRLACCRPAGSLRRRLRPGPRRPLRRSPAGKAQTGCARRGLLACRPSPGWTPCPVAGAYCQIHVPIRRLVHPPAPCPCSPPPSLSGYPCQSGNATCFCLWKGGAAGTFADVKTGCKVGWQRGRPHQAGWLGMAAAAVWSCPASLRLCTLLHDPAGAASAQTAPALRARSCCRCPS